MLEDYAGVDRGRGLNFWDHDPVLRSEVERTYAAADHEWAESRLESFGGLVGETVAENADVVDEHGPELHTYDRDGELANAVEYHPAQLENERLVYESGAVADSFRAPPGRDERLPLLYNLTMDYLISYADIGLTCPVATAAARSGWWPGRRESSARANHYAVRTIGTP